MSARRVGHRQLNELRQRLSTRDTLILHSLRTYRLMQPKHLQALHFTDHATNESAARITRRTLARLTKQSLIVRMQRRIGGIRAGSSGHIYSLSPLGHRVLDTEGRKRINQPSLHHLNHTLAITDLGVNIHTHAIDHLDYWNIQPEPAAWRTYRSGLIENTLKPDLYVQVADTDYELSWFIEIDCGTESRPTIQRKCHAYIDYWRSGIEQQRHGIFPLVLWVAPDEQRARQLREAIHGDRRIDTDLFIVTTTNQALDIITDTESPP